jgi:diadenosine tetraphosphate (Ap4A) HIT family hydrolase
MGECPFGDASGATLTNGLANVRFERSPVNPGHPLIVTRGHAASYFDTTSAENAALLELLDERFRPAGCNIGINLGAVAGQAITHRHLHLIPRQRGDMPDPRGGVRGVIPAQQRY